MELIVGYAETVVALVCIVFVWHYYNKKSGSSIRKWPLVGMLPGLVHNSWQIHEYLTELLIKSGGTFEFKGPRFLNMDFLITSDPANVHYILTKNFKNFEKGSTFKNIFFDVLGDGIFIAELDSWKFQRKLTQLLIKHTNFQGLLEKTVHQKLEKGLFPILERASSASASPSTSTSASEKRIVVDLKDLFQRFTFDSNAILIFGSDPGCLSMELPEVASAKAFDEIEEVLLCRHTVPECFWKLQRWLQIGEEKKLSKAQEKLEQFLAQNISLKREFSIRRRRSDETNKKEEDEEEEGFDFLSSLLNKDDEEEEEGAIKMSNKFLRDLTLNLMAAGKDNVSAGLSWFFYLVATYPLVEIKILEEIKSKLLQVKKHDHHNELIDYKKKIKGVTYFSAKELSQLVYLHAAISESLRLYPPTPINHKATVEADILPSGHRIGPRTKILFSIYSMARMESTWGEDCLEFKPERWISKKGDIIHVPSYKFATFNAGPRSCIGNRITFVLMKTVATAIICNYHFQVLEGHPISPSNSVVLHMEHGLKVRVTKRQI